MKLGVFWFQATKISFNQKKWQGGSLYYKAMLYITIFKGREGTAMKMRLVPYMSLGLSLHLLSLLIFMYLLLFLSIVFINSED